MTSDINCLHRAIKNLPAFIFLMIVLRAGISFVYLEPLKGICQIGIGGERPPIQGKGLDIVEFDDESSILSDVYSERIGFGIAYPADSEYWAEQLRGGWYLDWQVKARSKKDFPEHWQMIRIGKGCISPSVAYVRWAAQYFPGAVWVIGNEPDVMWQDDTRPELYAEIYHNLYVAIKRVDPTARIAVGGVSQGSQLRLAYLDTVLQTYFDLYAEPMPVDWWTMHAYVINEGIGWGAGIPPGGDPELAVRYDYKDHGSLALFEQQARQFRLWMKKNDYKETPLAITEMGIFLPEAFGYDQQAVTEYLTDSFNILCELQDTDLGYAEDDDYLVQKWAWFSLNDPLYDIADLADVVNDQLTSTGLAFKKYILQEECKR